MMAAMMSESWTLKNQQYLLACMEQTKAFLKGHPSRSDDKKLEPGLLWNGEPLPAIEHVCQTFSLSSFERQVLLLCAAEELDSEVSGLCAVAHGNQNASYPTFSIALSALPAPHWSALSPTGPLRLFKLVSLLGLPQVPITRCQLRIEERVLHYLTGISYVERSLHGLVEEVRDDAAAAAAVKSHDSSANLVLHAWGKIRPLRAQLVGPDEASKKTVASSVCRQLGLGLWQISGEIVPQSPEELETLVQVWDRESALLGSALYVKATDLEPAAEKVVKRLLTRVAGPAFLSTSQHWQQDSFMPVVEVSKPTKREQRLIWESFLGTIDEQLSGAISQVLNQFDLSAASIQSAASDAVLTMSSGEDSRAALWAAGKKVAQPTLSELAKRITPKATMDDLVLGEREKELLRGIIASARQRLRVYEEWGFASTNERGLGISVLFAGDNGTGKTTAAEAIAHELDLDLYRIDLSIVVNKYIGETEKNLKRIFDSAEDGGAILLFDEADALFGKRSEVKDSHDRYSNIEVGYLLQRMESYRGLAVLTTNMKNSLDNAFTRRIRFTVNFPFPDEKSRIEIWKKVFPKSVPVDDLDIVRLARFDLAGGNIRNIALGASFMAADEDLPINMTHIARATRQEYDKIGRPFPAGRLGP
jgi:AAA+ superfamily predicted ATPase